MLANRLLENFKSQNTAFLYNSMHWNGDSKCPPPPYLLHVNCFSVILSFDFCHFMFSCSISSLPCVDTERIWGEKCFSAVLRLASKPGNVYKSHIKITKRGEPELSSVNPLVGSQVARRAVLSRAPGPHAGVPLTTTKFSSISHYFLLTEYFYLGVLCTLCSLGWSRLCQLFIVGPLQQNFYGHLREHVPKKRIFTFGHCPN